MNSPDLLRIDKPAQWDRSGWIFNAVVVAIFAGICGQSWHHFAHHSASAWSTYYNAANLVAKGQNPYGAMHSYPYVYPPLLAWALEPMGKLPFVASERVALLILAGATLLAFRLSSLAMLRELGLPTDSRSVAAATLLTTLLMLGTLLRDMHTEQINPLILLCLSLALLWMNTRPTLAGASLALGICIKHLPMVLLPYLILRRRWRAAITAAVFTIFFSLLPSTTLGLHTTETYLATAYAGLGHALGIAPAGPAAHVHSLTDVINISVTSSLARLARQLGWPSKMGIGLTAIVAGVWIGAILLAYRSRGISVVSRLGASDTTPLSRRLFALESNLLILFVIAFSPNGEMMLAGLPMALLAALLVGSDTARRSALVLMAAVICFVAILFPIALIGHASTELWYRSALSCWLLLIAFVLVVMATLQLASGKREPGVQD